MGVPAGIYLVRVVAGPFWPLAPGHIGHSVGGTKIKQFPTNKRHEGPWLQHGELSLCKKFIQDPLKGMHGGEFNLTQKLLSLLFSVYAVIARRNVPSTNSCRWRGSSTRL